MYLTKRRIEKFDPLCCDAWSDSFPTVITTASIAAKRIPKDLAQPHKVRKRLNALRKQVMLSTPGLKFEIWTLCSRSCSGYRGVQ